MVVQGFLWGLFFLYLTYPSLAHAQVGSEAPLRLVSQNCLSLLSNDQSLQSYYEELGHVLDLLHENRYREFRNEAKTYGHVD